MGTRATAGTCLQALVKMAVPLLREAEHRCPRTGPGAKPDIPDWLIGVLIMVGVLKRRKSKSAQFRFLSDPANRPRIVEAAGCDDFPSRSTFFRRYRRAHTLLRTAIKLQGEKAIAEGVADPEVVAVDKSLIAARGPLWHKRDRQAGRIPKGLHGVDQESTWGCSQHDGWVQGYSFEVVVTATAGSTVFPLVASADTASVKETQTVREKIAALSTNTYYVLADSGYDSNEVAEQIEYDEEDRRTGCRFLCPENRRGSKRKRKGEAPQPRDERHRRRLQRRKFLKSRKGQRLYARRGQTVEPFNDWFKGLFELDQRVWHRGLDNNRTQMLAAIFAYQLLVRYNYRRGNQNGQVKWIMDCL
jgi:Transposase DDE domain